MDLGNIGLPLLAMGPLPGQERIRLAKKGGAFPEAGSGLLPFMAGPSHSPRVSLRKGSGRKRGGWFPALFAFAGCALARATIEWV